MIFGGFLLRFGAGAAFARQLPPIRMQPFPGSTNLAICPPIPRTGLRVSKGGGVEADRALNLLNDMLWQALVVAAPILIATLAIGLVVSVFQVATQIQEATLSYVPKLLVAAGLTILLGPWMMTRVTDFARGLYLAIPMLAS